VGNIKMDIEDQGFGRDLKALLSDIYRGTGITTKN
jgi:hypothetical protein